MRFAAFLIVPLLILFTAGSAAAQTAQKFSVQGSFLYAQLGGEAFQDESWETAPGMGFELQARYNPGALSFGVGYQYSNHPVSIQGAENLTVDDEYSGLFIEPRYVIFIGSDRAAPYVSARLMALTNTLTFQEEGFEDVVEEYDAWGYTFGGGILVRLGSRMNADVGFTAGAVTFVFDDPEFENSTGTSGVFRVGFAVGI